MKTQKSFNLRHLNSHLKTRSLVELKNNSLSLGDTDTDTEGTHSVEVRVLLLTETVPIHVMFLSRSHKEYKV